MKSEEPLSDDEQALNRKKGKPYITTGRTFKKDVLEVNKDVFVAFHAPWCGHCKRMEPIYNEFARKLAHVDTLRIAKLDATRNEVDGVRIQGYPTFYLFKANAKDKPVEYNLQGRTVENWSKSKKKIKNDEQNFENLKKNPKIFFSKKIFFPKMSSQK